MTRRRFAVRGVAAALAATTIVAVTGVGALPADATPVVGSVVASPAPPPEAILSRRVHARADGIGLTLPAGSVVRSFTLTYGSGSSSGWHQHPGVVVATVITGSVTRAVPCRPPEVFTAGQAFVEVGPHLVQNTAEQDAVLSITQIAPAGTTGSAFREDLPTPVCRPHHP